MKKHLLIIILFSLAPGSSLFGQSINVNFPQLNAGGYINAIVEDTVNNKIYIAGNFTSVNGISRKNLARISYNILFNSYTVDNWIPVTAMAGEIKCMAIYGNSLFIGGDYTSVNGNVILDYFTKISISSSAFDLGFDPDPAGPIFTVNDLIVNDDKLYIAGSGTVWDDGNFYGRCFAVYDLLLNTVDTSVDVYSLYPSMNWGSLEIVRLHVNDSRVYLCGKNFGGLLNDGIVALNKSNYQLISSFNPSFTFEQVIDCETFGNKVYIVNSKIWPGGESVMELDEATGNLTIGSFSISNNGTPYSISRYKNYLFIAGTFQYFQSQLQNYLGAVDLLSGILPLQRINWEPLPNAGMDSRYALFTLRNRLFVSDNNLTSVSSTAKNGMASYCLEPYDPVALSLAQASVCPAENYNYTIQQVPYAWGYSWWYSGTDVVITTVSNQTVNLAFGENATSGTLFVAPFSRCNLYSDTLAFSITVHPRPDADAGTDSTLNCVRLSLDLEGFSSVVSPDYQWSGPSGFFSTLQNPTVVVDGNYILTVTNTFTGCTQNDTVIITQDTVRPDIGLPPGPFVLTCAEPSVLMDGNSSAIPTTLYWNKFNGGIYPDPFYADSVGQYFLVVTNTRNGCKDSNFVVVNENRVPPEIEISSHSGISSLTIDTLTCNSDTLLVSGASVTPNAIFHWEDTTGFLSAGDTVFIMAPAAYSLFVTDTSNGCVSQQNFFIAEYKTPPQINLPAGITDLTCSNDTVFLDGTAITGNTDLFWSGPGNFNVPDPVFANDTGYYYLHAVRTDNGCTAIDSIYISKIPLIETSISNDTMVCAGSAVDILVSVTGNFSSLNYSWSGSMQNSAQITVFPFTTTQFIVTVTDSSGCAGSDSVTITIPEPITDSVLTFASCDTTVGEIQVYATGGIPPYSYSIDNGNTFQSSPVFMVFFGNYDLIIQDSLGCRITEPVSVNENSQLPEPDFLVSTYCFSGDTLVMVNISNPQPDSLEWIFPPSSSVVLNAIETPWIILPDTGDYQITLRATYGNCHSEKTKTIYVRQPDSTIASFYNKNGIDTVLVYPNPNSGIFDLEIVLFRKQDFSVNIYDLSGIRQFTDFVLEEDEYHQTIQLGNLQNGTYLLRVTAEFDAQSVYFIIQK